MLRIIKNIIKVFFLDYVEGILLSFDNFNCVLCSRINAMKLYSCVKISLSNLSQKCVCITNFSKIRIQASSYKIFTLHDFFFFLLLLTAIDLLGLCQSSAKTERVSL